jgi:metallo-beta-lactamase class B
MVAAIGLALTSCRTATPSNAAATSAAPTTAPATAAPATAAPGTAAAGEPRAGKAPPLPDEARINSELSLRRVARDAWVVTHEPFHASNVLVVRMADGTLILSSSPFDTEAAHALLNWLFAMLHPPRLIAINTHFHLDGTGGNEAYTEFGVETHASDKTQALIYERGVRRRNESAAAFSDPALRARVERTRVVAADHTFPAEAGLRLTIAGETVQVIHPGPAHSPDNVVVHFPARGLLFGGCMIKTGSSIGYTGDADIERWEAAVRALEPLAASVIVPGHGETGGPELLRNTIDVVRAARAAQPSSR